MTRDHDVFGDLRAYQTGEAQDGSPTFAIPLEPDEDGMVGRECPDQDCTPRYFKIMPVAEPSEGVPEADTSGAAAPRREGFTCPYCGRYGDRGSFFTHQQMEMVKSSGAPSAPSATCCRTPSDGSLGHPPAVLSRSP